MKTFQRKLKSFNHLSDSINLFLFNKKPSDIWLREHFEKLQQVDKRFSVTHILSEQSVESEGYESGRITKEIVGRVVQTATFVFICGNPIFNDISMQLLKEHETEMHCFQG